MQASEMMVFIERRHSHWWAEACHRIPTPITMEQTPPTIKWVARRTRWYGRGNAQCCTYNLMYALAFDEKFDSIIRHEVAHVYAARLALLIGLRAGKVLDEHHENLWRYCDQMIGGDGRRYSSLVMNGEGPRCLKMAKLLLEISKAS